MKKAFETVSVEFSITGRTGSEQVFSTGARHNVTPAEFQILEQIHRKENVKVISDGVTGKAVEFERIDDEGKEVHRARSHDEEVDRLKAWYGEKHITEVFGKRPVLPYTFAAAGIPVTTPDNVRALSGRRGRAKAEETKNDAVEDLDDQEDTDLESAAG